MYLDNIIIILITVFATLAAAECGLTLKKAIAPFKLMFGGLSKVFGQNKEKEKSNDDKAKTQKPEGL